jgi:quercetin dioxygenase-like cupin family protein
MPELLHFQWRDKVVFSAEGPKPQVLLESPRFRVVLVGLEAGQRIPPHPAPEAVYQVLDGSGTMLVGGERIAVEAGSLVVVPSGVARGFEATTRLAFAGSRGGD